MDLKRVNGYDISWGSSTLKINGQRLWGGEEVEFGDKRTREFVYGMDRAQEPRGITRGEYQPNEGRILMPMSSHMYVISGLAVAAGSTSYGDAKFLVDMQFQETGLPLLAVQLVDTYVTGVKENLKRGPGVLMAEYTIMYRKVVRNGLTLSAPSE